MLILMSKSPNLVQSKSVIEKYSSYKPLHIEPFTAQYCAICTSEEVVNDSNQCACRSNQYFRDMNSFGCVPNSNPCGSDTKYYQVNSSQYKLEEIQISCYNCSNNEIATTSKSNCYCPTPYSRNSNYPYQCDYASNICSSNQSYTTINDFSRGETIISCSNCGRDQIRDPFNNSQCVCVSGMKQTYYENLYGTMSDLGCQQESNPCGNPNYYWINNLNNNTITCRQCSNNFEIGMLGGCVCNSNNYIRRENDETCVDKSFPSYFCRGGITLYDGTTINDQSSFSFTSNSSPNNYSLSENTVLCTYCGSNQQRKTSDTSQCECKSGYYYHEDGQCKSPTDACSNDQSYTIRSSNITCTDCGTNEIRDPLNSSTCVCKPNYSKVKHETSVGNTNDIGCQPNDNPCGTLILGSNYYWITDASASLFQGFICKKCKDPEAVGRQGGCTCEPGYTRRSNDDKCILDTQEEKCVAIAEPLGTNPTDSYYKYSTLSMANDYGFNEQQIVCTLCGANQVRGPNSNTCVCDSANGYIWKPDVRQCVLLDNDVCNTRNGGSNIQIIGSNNTDTYGQLLGGNNYMSNLSCDSCSDTQVANLGKTECETCIASSFQYPNANHSRCIQCSNYEELTSGYKCKCRANYIYTEYSNPDHPDHPNIPSQCKPYNNIPTNLCLNDGFSTPYNQYRYQINAVTPTTSTDYGSKVVCTKCTISNSVRGSGTNTNNCVCPNGYYFYNNACHNNTYNPCAVSSQELVYSNQTTDADSNLLSSGVMSNITCRTCDSLTETYSSEKCLCKAGYYRDTDVVSLKFGKCVECGSGTYKDVIGDQSCSICNSPDQYVRNNRTECITCVTGSSNTGSSCVCASNYQIRLGANPEPNGSHCEQCPTGSYKLTPGDVSCTVCSTHGQFFDASTGNCEYCGVNQEPNSDDSGCTPCAGGYYSASNEEDCSSEPCAANSIPKSDGTGCSNCLVGYRSPIYNNNCYPCLPNQIPSIDGIGCDYCGTNQVRRSDSNLCKCASGTIFNSNNSNCYRSAYPCTNNDIDDYNYSYVTTSDSPLSHESGLYDEYVTCTLCTKGGVRGTGNNADKCVCSSGYFNTYYNRCSANANPCSGSLVPDYSLRSNDVNDIFLLDGYTMSNVSCVPCDNTEVKDDATATCVCKEGYYRDISGLCVKCATGTYKAWIGDLPCSNCSTGSTTTIIGSTSCVCMPGYGATSTSYSNDGSHCSECLAGTVKAGFNNDPCYSCSDEDKYQDAPRQSSCKTCYDSVTSINSNNIACVCRPGYGIPSGTSAVNDGSNCSICPAGTVKAGSNNNTCSLCSVSSEYQDVSGQFECKTCGNGSNVQNNRASCVECGYGMYRGLGGTCTNMAYNEIGTTINVYGVYTAVERCPNNGVRGPTGTKQNRCICPTNTFYSSTNNSCYDTTYINNSLCSNIVKTYGSQTNDMKGTSFSYGYNLSNISCSSCTGHNQVYDSSTNSCVCDKGYYSNAGTCQPCGTNTYKNVIGDDQSLCSFCPSNSTTNGLNGQTTCVCNPGYTNYSSTGCTQLPDQWNDSNQFANVLSDYDNNFSIHQMINPVFNHVITRL